MLHNGFDKMFLNLFILCGIWPVAWANACAILIPLFMAFPEHLQKT